MFKIASLEHSGTDSFAKPSQVPTAEVHDVFHEVGTELTDQVVETTVPIDSSSPPVAIKVRSHLITGAARSLRSPAYLASVRRRKAKKIVHLVRALGQHATKDEFAVWTQEPLEELRRLIEELSDAEEHANPESEGNSCEILRQVRDTFLNCGWECYREHDIRTGVCQILETLTVEDEVTADDADSAMDKLLAMKLNPSVGLAWTNVEEEKDEVLG